MPLDLMMIERDGSLWPFMDDDRSKFAKLPKGQGFRVELVRQSKRSLKHHRLYWSGLIGLMLHYWHPVGGMIKETESVSVKAFASWLDKQTSNKGIVPKMADQFLDLLAQKRAQNITPPDMSEVELKNQVHIWIKEQSGFYDLVWTPGGISRQVKSISFERLGQDGFAWYFNSAFTTCWKFILSQHFPSRDAANNAINELIAMGG